MYTQLLEYTFKQFLRKQNSITSLFPKFKDRVRVLSRKGGIKLYDMLPDGLWHFKIKSSKKPGVKYDVYLKFKDLDTEIKTFVPIKKLWKKDGSGINYSELAAEIFNHADFELSCGCESDLYYGFKYIRTQRDAQFGDAENRRPKIKNPREKGIVCKHSQLLLTALPFYVQDLASYLKDYYGDEISKIENKAKGTK